MPELKNEIGSAAVSIADTEKKALALISGTPDIDYKRMVIYLTYRTITENPNITVKSIKWILKKYAIDKDLIDKVVAVLMSREVFNAIHFWPSTKTKGVKHYKINPNNETMQHWLDKISTSRPELNQFCVAKPRK